MSSRFNVCDLSAIETRVGAWVSECGSLLKVFEEKKDPYLDFATKMTGIPYEKLLLDYRSKDEILKSAAKQHRQMAKPAVLGAIYRLGGGGWGRNKYGDKIKTGLWGYAENMGVTMTEQQANDVVRVFRNSYTEVCGTPDRASGFKGGIWYILEDAVKDVLNPNAKNVVRTVGPNGCIRIDKLVISQTDETGEITKRNILRIQLPSGRYLHYLDARIEDSLMPWKDSDGSNVYKPTLVYAGMNQDTKQWDTYVTSHGGKIFENIVQGIARDILAIKLLLIEALGILICAHVHDEGVGETDDDQICPDSKDMEEIMSQPVVWAPGLRLAAEGFNSKYYHK